MQRFQDFSLFILITPWDPISISHAVLIVVIFVILHIVCCHFRLQIVLYVDKIARFLFPISLPWNILISQGPLQPNPLLRTRSWCYVLPFVMEEVEGDGRPSKHYSCFKLLIFPLLLTSSLEWEASSKEFCKYNF